MTSARRQRTCSRCHGAGRGAGRLPHPTAVCQECPITSDASCLAGYGSYKPSLVETAVQTYIRAAGERDPAAREKLLDACFADDGRVITRSGVIRGRAGVDAMIARFHADPQMLGFRMASVI